MLRTPTTCLRRSIWRVRGLNDLERPLRELRMPMTCLRGLIWRKKNLSDQRNVSRASSVAEGSVVGFPAPDTSHLKSGNDQELVKVGGITFVAEPSTFSVEGRFELLDDIDKFRECGISCEAGRVLSQVIKSLHAAALLNEDVRSLEQKHFTLESSVSGLKGRIRELEVERDMQIEKATVANEKARKAEEELEKEKAVSMDLRNGREKALRDSVVITKRKLMKQIVAGEDKYWKPEEQIRKCNILLGDVSDESEDGEDAEGSAPVGLAD